MRAKFNILDCQGKYFQVKLTANHDTLAALTLVFVSQNDYTNMHKSNQLIIDIKPIDLHYVLKELEVSDFFRRKAIRYLKNTNQLVVFKVIPVSKGVLDYEWCKRAQALSWEKVEQENLMSWLSTLGGAFSALGDSFEKCAETAGKISMYQLKIAVQSGDPSIVSRCKLYYSISLIQKGRLRAAKYIVRKEYASAKTDHISGDDRVYKMCHGIWLKLQYSYHLRKQKRLETIQQPNIM